MPLAFESIHNHFERSVIEAVQRLAEHYPLLQAHDDWLADVACVALNRLPARYVRHAVDLAFYQSEKERARADKSVTDAVHFAFEFVQARVAMRARG